MAGNLCVGMLSVIIIIIKDRIKANKNIRAEEKKISFDEIYKYESKQWKRDFINAYKSLL